MNLQNIILVSISVTTLFNYCRSDNQTYVTLYSGHYDYARGYGGAQLNVNIDQCSNLASKGWTRMAASIGTRGYCARLFDKESCAGKFIEITPTSPSHNNLGNWDFEDKIMSVGPCRDKCSAEVIRSNINGTFQVDLWAASDFKGKTQRLEVSGCELVPTSFGGVYSLNARGQCVQLYSNDDCNEHLGRTVELRQGAPYHDDLSQWEMTRPKSISHCGYKCVNDSVMLSSRQKLQQGDIILFNDRNLKGDYVKISINDSECREISSEWKSSVGSILLGENTCISVFDQHGCKGDSFNMSESHWLFAKSKFGGHICSIKPCNSYKISTTSSNIDTSTESSEHTLLDESHDIQTSTGGAPSLGRNHDKKEKTDVIWIIIIIILVLIAAVITIIMISRKYKWSPNVTCCPWFGTVKSRLFERFHAEEREACDNRHHSNKAPGGSSRSHSNVNIDHMTETEGWSETVSKYQKVYKETVTSC